MRNERLIDLRKQRGETQEEVARSLGVSRSMYAMIELGERLGKYPLLKKIADYYQTTIEELFDLQIENVSQNETCATKVS